MGINVNVPVEFEDALRRRAESAGKDLSTFAGELLMEEVADELPIKRLKRRMSFEQYKAKIQELIDLHPGGNGKMDDSRESIYEGCGE